MRLRGLRCLDSAVEGCELILRHLLAAKQRVERIHQEHLYTDQLGEDMDVHLCAVFVHSNA